MKTNDEVMLRWKVSESVFGVTDKSKDGLDDPKEELFGSLRNPFFDQVNLFETLHNEQNTNNRIFWVDERVFPTVVDWRTNASKDGMPMNGTYSVEVVRVLDTHRTPIQKQPEMLLCLVEISRRYFLGDEVNGPIQFDSCLKSDKAVATDSSGVPSTIEKSSLDFAHEDGASNQGTAALEMPPPKDVPATAAPGVGQAKEVVAAEPHVARESRKRGHDGVDANAPPKSFRRDHADLRLSGSSHGGKSLAAMQLCLASNVFVYEGTPADVSDPDPLSFIDAPSHHPVDVAHLLDTPEACQDLVDHAAPLGYFSKLRHMHNEEFLGQYNINLARQVAMGSQLRLRFEQEAKLLRKSVSQVARRDQRIQARELEIKNLEARLETEAGMRKAAEDKSVVLIKELEDLLARFSDLQVGNEHLSRQVATLQEQPSQATESIEAYDPEAEAKFVAALQSLKDLKYPLLDQLEGLKDAPMDVIMAALYLESDTGRDAPQYIRDLCPSSSQLTILVYPEVHDPRNPWAYKEEIKLSDAITANISRAEKKKKCRIVCCTHGVGSTHHARSDGVPVSVPTVVPQGLALLLVDAPMQTDLEDA
nr:hypothetical protein [Tanacetum cinerariifolium]GEZ53569.1 hypothetical protein [Tanacetum cinerariifolium]